MNSYHLALPSLTSSIAQVEPFVRSIPATHQLGADRYHDLLVAITEAVNNAIIHGNALNPEKQVLIDIQASPEELIVVVQDNGSGFDPNTLPDPRRPENLLREGGRGVFLIKHLADLVEFTATDSGMAVMLKYFY